MKIAIVGTREGKITDFGHYLTEGCDEIVSGGAKGIDSCASEYAKRNGIKLTEFLPEYDKYGRAAPIIRNKQIVDYADKVIAFWDGDSKGTKSVISYGEKTGTPLQIVFIRK